MHAVIHHYINDPAKWERSVKNIMSLIEEERLPKEVKPLEYLPSADGRQAACVWEATSLASLRQFVDRETAGARNEYFEVNANQAIGLPRSEAVLETHQA